MVERRQVDQRAELQPLGALGHGGEVDAGGGGQPERGPVVLGGVVGIEAQPVQRLHQLQPGLEVFVLGQPRVVHVVEHAEFHARPPAAGGRD